MALTFAVIRLVCNSHCRFVLDDAALDVTFWSMDATFRQISRVKDGPATAFRLHPGQVFFRDPTAFDAYLKAAAGEAQVCLLSPWV